LEGRYPATATLQNANSDDAAAEWMRNATHMRYTPRWLQTALRQFVPVADRVLAGQLDDDQGAYIDNQTWPAPHLRAYLRELERSVRAVTGPQLPAFINTYEMKVTASAPVWAMGNWYQSDAYAIGEHYREVAGPVAAAFQHRGGPLRHLARRRQADAEKHHARGGRQARTEGQTASAGKFSLASRRTSLRPQGVDLLGLEPLAGVGQAGANIVFGQFRIVGKNLLV